MSEPSAQGPAWDLTEAYPDPESGAVDADLRELDDLLERMAQAGARLGDLAPTDGDAGADQPGTLAPKWPDSAIVAAQDLFKHADAAGELLGNLSTFASCLLSVNSRDEGAQALRGRLERYTKRYQALHEPLSQFIARADDDAISLYLQDPAVGESAFLVAHARERRHEQLGLSEEKLESALARDGLHAWGALYGQLSGTLRCTVERDGGSEEMGLAAASSLLGSRSVEERRAAWRAINAAWTEHEETCAAALNAIAGWRLEMAATRSHTRPVHFLDAPVHMNRLSPAILDAMLEAAACARPLAQRAARLMGRAYGLDTIGPWDQRAPAPSLGEAGSAPIPFDEAMATVASAYGQVDPSMGEFVEMMAERRWIEGTVGPAKRPGAYCTRFAKARTPRVYMTYTGTVSDVITLAHELGHAYHGWVMRDLPRCQQSYGMSLAETASVFGETLVRDALLARAATPAERLDIAWEELAALEGFVLNIPTRFAFERRFYERRAERPLRPAELRELMSEAWVEWYGESLAEPDPCFWMSKLHFYISGLSFYNFPYLFGYLFSLGVYTRRAAQGEAFFDRFNALLGDTGRMTAEDLARKHLDVSLESPAFWEQTLDSIGPRVDAFESLLDELGLGA